LKKHNLTDKFVKYWEVLANKFAKNKFVIGFDPLNEPFPADF
jgi:aryl-phospho-beta-D-glucosidase BglC (GH1 family)